MSNVTLCAKCESEVSLDEVMFIGDEPVCEECQKEIEVGELEIKERTK